MMQDIHLEEVFFSMRQENLAQITVLGAGGMGGNFVETLAGDNLQGVHLHAVNTDLQALDACTGSHPVQIGKQLTKGQGAGGDSKVGRASAEESIEPLRAILKGSDVVFVVAGMGGGTGTGAAPVIARLAREMKILTIGIVTTPISLEGRKRLALATEGLNAMRAECDSLIIVSNDRISSLIDNDDLSFVEVFQKADSILIHGVKGITKIINTRGYINVDLADAQKVLRQHGSECSGEALIGIGEASGEDRAMKAVCAAIENPLLPKGRIAGAKNLLIYIVGSSRMGYKETQTVIRTVVEKVGKETDDLCIGMAVDESLGEKISVTVMATGFLKQADHGDPDKTPPKRPRQIGLEEYALQSDHFRGNAGQRPADGRPAGYSGHFSKAIWPHSYIADWEIPAYLRRNASRQPSVPPGRQPSENHRITELPFH